MPWLNLTVTAVSTVMWLDFATSFQLGDEETSNKACLDWTQRLSCV